MKPDWKNEYFYNKIRPNGQIQTKDEYCESRCKVLMKEVSHCIDYRLFKP